MCLKLYTELAVVYCNVQCLRNTQLYLFPFSSSQVVGIVYLSERVSETLLSFYSKPPLDACTYMGVDSGQPELKVGTWFKNNYISADTAYSTTNYFSVPCSYLLIECLSGYIVSRNMI